MAATYDMELCTGCGACVEACPVDVIAMRDGKDHMNAIALNADGFAEIDEAECIRCGRCHDACPQDAVRHEGERIPQEVAENLEWVHGLLRHFYEP